METMPLNEKNRRWRLLLGPEIKDRFEGSGQCELSEKDRVMDEALAAIYDQTDKQSGFDYTGGSDKSGGGKGKSSPVVARWASAP